MLEQVVNDALPGPLQRGRHQLRACSRIGQPEIEVTKIEDGEELTFTAEVDVRPEIDPARPDAR